MAASNDLEDLDQAQIHTRLGMAYLRIGEPALALLQLETAVTLGTDNPSSWAYLGLAQDQDRGVRPGGHRPRRPSRPQQFSGS